MGFFGDLPRFEIIVTSIQALGILGVVTALLFAWSNLRIIKQRMRLEIRPILKIDLEVPDPVRFIPEGSTVESRAGDSWPRSLKFTVRNLQSNTAGTSLGAEIKFVLFTSVNGKEYQKGFFHSLPVIEANEISKPTQLCTIEIVDRFVAQVLSVKYHDVDGNFYSRAHGAIHVEGGKEKETVTNWGELK